MGLIPNLGDPSDPQARPRYGYLQAGVAIAVNASLFSSKIFLAALLTSVAVLTDAFNQLGDVGISAMVFIAFRFAAKKADTEHPFGHGRLEQIAALLVAAFLLTVAVFLLIESAAELQSPSVQGSLTLALILAVLAGVKEGLARFSFAIAKRIDSDAIRGDAWNHRFDALITGGIALAIYLASLHAGLRILDPVFGILVSLIILYHGAQLVRSAGDRLLGRAPSEAMIDQITSLASELGGVKRVHSIAVHDYGLHKAISLSIEVSAALNVEQAHEIATEVEAKIKSALKADAIVHVEPAVSTAQKPSEGG